MSGDPEGYLPPDLNRMRAWLGGYEGLSLGDARELARQEGRPVRLIRPGELVTLDLNTGRLNLWVDTNGDLEGISAG